MDGIFALIGLAIAAYFIGGPIVLFVMIGNTRKRIDALAAHVAKLEGAMAAGVRAPAEAGAAVEEPDEIPPAPTPDEAGAQGPDETPVAPVSAGAEDSGPRISGPWTPRPPSAEPEATPEVPAETPQPAAARSMEESFASKWMIWLGALTIGLAAVFLFTYAIDQGWLTPLFRVIAGLALGGALIGGGEWLERRPARPSLRGRDFIPSALSGAGIFAIFVSLFSAHALYGLMGPTQAFIALGLTAYAALALALRQGWFVALMGLIGGYLVPLMIIAPDSSPVPLFLYLFVLGAACLALMTARKWWWFSALTLLGALAWPALWLLEAGADVDQLVLGLYALGMATLFALLSTGLPLKTPDTPLLRWLSAMISDTSGLGFTACGVLLLMTAAATGFDTGGFVFLGLYGLVALVLATRRAALESLVVAAALIVLASAVLWPAPELPTGPAFVSGLPVPAFGPGYGPFVMPPEYVPFARALLGFAALFGIGGAFGARGARTPAVWAGTAAAMPVLLFIIGYWRIGGLQVDISWATLAAALALAFLVTAWAEARRTGRSDTALALYAAGSTAALALAFTCLLREAWLTVTLSVEVTALAWIWRQLPVRELRALAAVVTSVIIVRLCLNPGILDYDGGIPGVVGWVLYGYGLPAVALAVAARWFARDNSDLLVPLCEVAALGFALLMVSTQLLLWSNGELGARWQLTDHAIQTIWWTIAAALLLHARVVDRRPWAQWIGIGLLSLALAASVLFQVMQQNPIATGMPVGSWPLVNGLTLAYLIPAILFGTIAALRDFHLPKQLRQVTGGVAGLLAFVWVTLETRRAFRGSDLTLTPETMPETGELYAYSVVWILFALALLAVGVWRRAAWLRYASLGVLMIAVAKAFLVDMSGLTGLFRVASFLGLGLSLIGIGRVYQLFVLRPDASGPEPEGPEDQRK
ncbi:hypothetical protein ATO6_05160 [Oceanicola sp. 22II-s10i]|uniref:DUF2339 domain-containing protein n=1 Tax=Oceanicola sp. 22II-s10i TaxID=1317116 RepID=UPI000B522A52|nr:DUF2339 domain-containing protein [Oceanicola sp. 22II-s10i]OWU86229.1 hypothetical protein ATO6_05160 [Oceanicola sp. 22II-s10i]